MKRIMFVFSLPQVAVSSSGDKRDVEKAQVRKDLEIRAINIARADSLFRTLRTRYGIPVKSKDLIWMGHDNSASSECLAESLKHYLQLKEKPSRFLTNSDIDEIIRQKADGNVMIIIFVVELFSTSLKEYLETWNMFRHNYGFSRDIEIPTEDKLALLIDFDRNVHEWILKSIDLGI